MECTQTAVKDDRVVQLELGRYLPHLCNGLRRHHLVIGIDGNDRKTLAPVLFVELLQPGEQGCGFFAPR